MLPDVPTTTINITSFQTAVAEVADAIAERAWADAWSWMARAEAIDAGLPTSASDASASVSRRQSLTGLREALVQAQAQITRHTDTRRTATVSTGFGS